MVDLKTAEPFASGGSHLELLIPTRKETAFNSSLKQRRGFRVRICKRTGGYGISCFFQLVNKSCVHSLKINMIRFITAAFPPHTARVHRIIFTLSRALRRRCDVSMSHRLTILHLDAARRTLRRTHQPVFTGITYCDPLRRSSCSPGKYVSRRAQFQSIVGEWTSSLSRLRVPSRCAALRCPPRSFNHIRPTPRRA